MLLFIYEYYALLIRAPETAEEIDFMFNIYINLSAGFLAGLLGGPFLVFSVSQHTRTRPYYYGLLYTAIGFFVIYFIISGTMSLIIISNNLNRPIFSKEVLIDTKNNLLGVWQIKNIIIWTLMISVTQFVMQINDKFGPGNLWKLVRGKYYRPAEEKRVFMFLDLKSATTIAEEIGHKKYYNFLNDFFTTITNPILNHMGEIYQYVGDEIVVSWTINKAIRNNNCLNCFFNIQKSIHKESSRFVAKYGITPNFKAGIHFGSVTVGEIGIIKRDIVYSGDVLNTTSRIQESCNELEADLLVSEDIISLLKNVEGLRIDYKGDVSLKGKLKKVKIASVSEIGD